MAKRSLPKFNPTDNFKLPSNGQLRHGRTGASVYKIWQAMIRRCCNPKDSGFQNYGGRGIRVCERWRFSFEAFLEDMGERPSPKHSIDRIDNDGDYEPSNCEWQTRKRQSRNRRSTRYFTINGLTKSFADWCDEYEIKRAVVDCRLRRGWIIEEALTTPLLTPDEAIKKARRARVRIRLLESNILEIGSNAVAGKRRG